MHSYVGVLVDQCRMQQLFDINHFADTTGRSSCTRWAHPQDCRETHAALRTSVATCDHQQSEHQSARAETDGSEALGGEGRVSLERSTHHASSQRHMHSYVGVVVDQCRMQQLFDNNHFADTTGRSTCMLWAHPQGCRETRCFVHICGDVRPQAI